MPHSIMPNPWRIIESDGEDDSDQRFYRSVSSPPKPTFMHKLNEPKTPDWNPIINEEPHKKKFGRRKTAPSCEHAPSDHKPIFSGRTSLKPSSTSSSSSNSLLEQNENDKTIVTNTPENLPNSSINHSNFDPFLSIQRNLNQFIYTYIPKDYPVFIRCCLRRDKDGIQKGFFPIFYLHAERPNDGKKTFLLAARKLAKVNRQSEYIITTNIETLSEKSGGDGYVGKLRENNIAGTEYTLYDNGTSPNKYKNGNPDCKKGLRRELASVIYNTNILGLKGPRQINAVIPKLECDIQPTKDEDTILDQWHDRRFNHLLQLRNRLPEFIEETKVHMLQFNDNRTIKPSIKNFQIIIENENHEEEVIMQFGRLNKDTFACDYRYPLSTIQAFGIALSSFESRLIRE